MEGLAGDAIVAARDSLEARVYAHGGPPHRADDVEAARGAGRVARGRRGSAPSVSTCPASAPRRCWAMLFTTKTKTKTAACVLA
jgi:hypothetical protein